MGRTPHRLPDPCELIPVCPVCLSGPITLSVWTGSLDICICQKCGTSLSVPHEAWDFRPKSVKKTPPK